MSEQAPEPAGGGGGGGAAGLFKRKIGPFPMWAWLLIGVALILGYVYLKRQQASQAATSATSESTAAQSAVASQIPQFVNQTYTSVTPPAAATTPAATSTGTTSTTPARPTQITASGADSGDLNQIAGKYGLTEQQLIAANPGLRKVRVHPANSKTKLVPLIGSGLPVPSGTVIKIPPIPAKA
jgi:hypothetical protein